MSNYLFYNVFNGVLMEPYTPPLKEGIGEVCA